MKRPSKSIALVKDGEPLPRFCDSRPLRVGGLAKELAERGHEVHWFSSTFLHQQKLTLYPRDTLTHDQSYPHHFLHSGSYSRNISPQRFLHHLRFACKLEKELEQLPSLDAIFCCIPMLEAAFACLRVARKRKIPLVLDVRDPWPEIFRTLAPPRLRSIVRLVLSPYWVLARRLFHQADSVTAVSSGFLEWAQRLGGRTESQAHNDAVFFHGAYPPSELEYGAKAENGKFRHVFLGAFGNVYDLNFMAQVAESMADDEGHHFLFIGEGSELYTTTRKRLERYPHITFTGWLSRGEAYRLARQCDLGWLPLRPGFESFMPNKPFEYASLGLSPVYPGGSDFGRLMEIREIGIAYQPGEPEELVRRLRSLSRANLKDWSKRVLSWWEEFGDARRCTQALASHLEAIASGGVTDQPA
ncbi:MAG: glycosyltransferase family 4 protein [Vulcanimicrobiota bacterium]